ncbi:MAG: sensor histidine kinase, partial [Candidatus Latescibacterota bacterium]
TNGDCIEVVATTHQNQAILSITDSGSGIAPKDLPHIFERFYRASSTRPIVTTGSGLGLAICQEIAHAHAGTLTAQSPPPTGKGSCFTLYLPLA